MKARKADTILFEIEPDNLQRLLKAAHHDIDRQLAGITAQLRQQADSTFGNGQPWNKASYVGFGDCLIAHGKALVDLGENFNSGGPPQWYVDQQAACANSAIGRLRKPDPTDGTKSSAYCLVRV